ncbi:hypothetical protein NQ314_015900 [Rhamnusium bicolor]|uniref:DDE Tnp4 domain-containing protein n=1 Tax=Rhamnusium bicolor TaxID=1586634 RepID=A0AAV8WXK8_9CUCU|nr:hypothetical protein NQ314_015900 [Rhamnusium bicolor]
MVLIVVVDADYRFINDDVGAYGTSSDSNIFKQSNLCKKLENNQLNIPQPRTLPQDVQGEPMPFIIVEDEAFALSNNVLHPYPRRNLNIAQRMYNYRLKEQEEWWNVRLVYSVINGEFFIVQLISIPIFVI